MNNKKIISLLGFFIIMPVLLIAYLNIQNSVNITIMSDKISLPLAYIMVFAVIEGVAAGFFLLYGFYLDTSQKLKEYQRKLEKTSVNADSESSKVAVLEAKIEVLEKALKSSIEQNNQ